MFIIPALLFIPHNSHTLNIALPDVQYTLALDLYMWGNYNSSIKEFNNLINEHPENTKYIGKAYYWIGLNYLSLKKAETAGKYFEKVINEYSYSAFYRNAYYYNGRVRYIRKHYNTAIKIFSTFYSKYPYHDLADNAMFWKGVCSWRQKKNKTALSYFYKVISKYSKGNKADASRYMIQLIKGGRGKTIVKTLPADTSYLDDWAELLKTKEEALKEKEKQIGIKEKTLVGKEKVINHAQAEYKIELSNTNQ